ncbi:MAG: PIN domain-containing protein [Propionibacteriaceae bacterium]|nr:PIN domain-containing protein [Propionibacteriaceae bacterium]
MDDHLDRVFIDTSELFPFTIMDVMLTLSDELIFTWVWTDELLDEWEAVIVREGRRGLESARSVANTARAHFASSLIGPALYRDQITADLSPDPGDRAHVAACLGGRATVLITRNLKHYQSPKLAEHGVRVMTADDYLCELLRQRPEAVTDSFIATANARTRPPVTPDELADRIAGAGAPTFAARVRRRLDG